MVVILPVRSGGSMLNKGLSNAVSVLIIIILLVSLAIPVLYYLINLTQANINNALISNNYIYLKELQNKQVTTGHPSLFYSGNYIYAEYTNGTFVPRSNFTIVGILYLNINGLWVNITDLKYPIVLSSNQALQLPSYVNGRPIIIVTSLGNVYFLQPGSAIGPYSSTVSSSGVEIITQVYTPSRLITVSANVITNITGTFKNYTTPASFPNRTGTFVVKAPQYVYSLEPNGSIITGVFKNWVLIGKAEVNGTNTLATRVTLENSPLVLIANYTLLRSYITLTIQTTDKNVGVNVSVDGRLYTVKGSDTIQIPAGYFNVTVLTLQFNDTTQEGNGVIKYYTFKNISYIGKTYVTYSAILFAPPNTSETLYINYVNKYNYYNVTFYDYNPPQGPVNVILNGTVYNYNQSYWIIGGNYSASYTGIIYLDTLYGNYSYGVTTLQIVTSQGSQTYKFPDIPSYIYINSKMTVDAYYNTTYYWYWL
ncbi:MAG: hypothetical protein RXN77_02070 [Sulfolobaceae archaeon]|nr:hypothetical protein [Sulfolobales archaeon]